MPVKVKLEFVEGPYCKKLDRYVFDKPRGITRDCTQGIIFVYIGGRTVKILPSMCMMPVE